MFLQQSQKVKRSIFKHTFKFQQDKFLASFKVFLSSSRFRSTLKRACHFTMETWAVHVSKHKSRADLWYPKHLYTINHIKVFKPTLGAGIRSQTGRRKQGDEQTTTIQTVLTVLFDWNTVHTFCSDLQSGRVNAIVAESQRLRASLKI